MLYKYQKCVIIYSMWGENLKLSLEEIVMLKLINNSITNKIEKIDIQDVDFEKLFKTVDEHSVNMICFDGVSNLKDSLPQNVYFDWMYFASRKMTNNEKLIKVQNKLTSLLEQNSIKYFVFKGLTFASYYQKPELRELGDIDYYVDYSDFKTVNSILKEDGFVLTNTKDSKHWSYVYDDIELEMHFGFWDMPDNDCSNFLISYLKNSVSNTKDFSRDDYIFKGTNPVSSAIIHLLHIINHMQAGGIGLRHICDYAVFLNSDDFKNNYQEIISVYKKGGIYKTAQIVMYICENYLSAPHYEATENVDTKLCELLLKDIITSGNFGRLSEETYHGSAVFTLDKSENSSFLNSLFTFCKLSWKLCEKYKILLPIAPFYIGTRYVFRALAGKRPKINPLKYTKEGLHRADLYKKLDFFKKES